MSEKVWRGNFSQLYIDGDWTEPATSDVLTVVSPYTEQPIAQVPAGSAADIDRAVAAARRAEAVALAQYRGGTATYLTVVTAQTLSLANQRTAEQLRGRQWLASVALIAATGGGWSATIGGTLSQRTTPSAHTLDQTQLDLSIGAQHKLGRRTVTMQAQYQHLRLDQQAFRDAAGGTLQLQYDLDARTQVGGFVQAFDFRFPGQPVRDARRLTVGATVARTLDGPRDPVLLANVYAGRERTREDVPQLDFDIKGVRVALSLRLDGGWQGYVSASHERRDYAADEPLFGVTRHDRQTDLRVGADKPIGRDWTLSPQFAWTRNASTLDPNDFRRTQLLVFARYRF